MPSQGTQTKPAGYPTASLNVVFGARGAPVSHARSGRRARKRTRTHRSCGASRLADVPESRWWRADAGEVETRSVGDRLVEVDAVPRGPSPKTFVVIKKLAEDRPWGHGRRIVAMVCFVGPLFDRDRLPKVPWRPTSGGARGPVIGPMSFKSGYRVSLT